MNERHVICSLSATNSIIQYDRSMVSTSNIQRNFNLFSSVYLIGIFLSLVYLLIEFNYFQISHFNNFFWNWDDFPGIPNVPEVSPLGNHYFGDFLHLITVSKNDLGTIPYWPYFPFANIFGLPFLSINYLLAYFLFASVFFLLTYINALGILKYLNFKDIVILLIFIFSNVGSVYLLDRGNIQLAVTAFISLGLFFLLKSKYKLFALFIGLAAALKVWPILFLVILLKRKEFKTFGIGVFCFVTANIVALLILDVAVGDFINFFSNQILEINSFNSYKGELWHAGGKNTSLFVIINIFEQNGVFSSIISSFLNNYKYLQLLALIIFIFLYLRTKVLDLTFEFLLISCFLLIVPTAQYGYAASILSILIPLLIINPLQSEINIPQRFTERIVNFIKEDSILITLGIVLVPWTIRIRDLSGDYRYPLDLNSVFSPMGLTFILFVTFWNLQPDLIFRSKYKI
jgi:hypothetical protein